MIGIFVRVLGHRRQRVLLLEVVLQRLVLLGVQVLEFRGLLRHGVETVLWNRVVAGGLRVVRSKHHGVGTFIIVLWYEVVEQGLEVPDLHHFALALLVLHQRVQLKGTLFLRLHSLLRQLSALVYEICAVLLGKLKSHYLGDVGGVGNFGVILLHLVDIVVLLQELLEAVCGSQVVFIQPKNLEGLVLRHETPFDPEALLGHLLPALVSELFALAFHAFFHHVLYDLFVSLAESERPHHLHLEVHLFSVCLSLGLFSLILIIILWLLDW